MPTAHVNIDGEEAKSYVNHYINRYIFENYQPIESLTDQQISTMANNLEVFLQTEIGTPNNYTISITLRGVDAETEVDDLEVISRKIRSIFLEIDIA